MNYSQTVREACKRHQCNVTTLEKRCGFSQGTIHRWDRTIPQIDKFEKVADVLGCSIDELCGRQDISDPAYVIEAARALTAEYSEDDMAMLQAFHTLSDSDRLQVMNLLMRLKFKKA